MPGSMDFGTCAAPGAAMAQRSARARLGRTMEPPELRGNARKDGLEHAYPVAGAEEVVHRALGMRHHSEDVPGCAHDARNRVHRSVRTPPLVRIARSAHVTKDDSTLPFDSGKGVLVCRVAAITVGDGNCDQLTACVAVREGGVSILDTEADGFAHKSQARIAQKRPWKQP